MHIDSTIRSLPETSVEKPGVLAVCAENGDLQRLDAWREVVAVQPQSDAYALLEEILEHPVLRASEAASSVVEKMLPEKVGIAIKGVWWVVGATRHGLALRSDLNKAAENRDLVGWIIDAAAHAVSGAALTGRIAARATPRLDDLGLLLRVGAGVYDGQDATLALLHNQANRSQAYRLADAMARLTEAALSDDPALGGVALNPLRLKAGPGVKS